MNDTDYKIVFIIGPPGSGKNTLTEELIKKFNIKTFGAGDLLREEVKKDTEKGREIANIINIGNIVPSIITVNLIKNKLDEIGKENLFIIDGFPRNKSNIDAWKELFNGEEGRKANIIALIELVCSEKTCESRLISRGLTSGRKDDDLAVIKRRFVTYKNESEVVVSLLEKDYLIINIDAEKSSEDVLTETIQKIKENKII